MNTARMAMVTGEKGREGKEPSFIKDYFQSPLVSGWESKINFYNDLNFILK